MRDMGDWNFNMSEAPKGHWVDDVKICFGKEVKSSRHIPRYVIAAGSGDCVTLSYWMPAAERWSMFSKDCPPIAWMHWPDHPAKK
jgi:hypothetical protein